MDSHAEGSATPSDLVNYDARPKLCIHAEYPRRRQSKDDHRDPAPTPHAQGWWSTLRELGTRFVAGNISITAEFPAVYAWAALRNTPRQGWNLPLTE